MSRPESRAELKAHKARMARFAKLEREAPALAKMLWYSLDYEQWDRLRNYVDAILDEAMQDAEDEGLEDK